MSVNPDAMDEPDYSDFEYQTVSVKHNHESPTGSPANSTIQSTYDVLGGIGGLDNNEVAELVWVELQVGFDHKQSDDDQDVGSATVFEGILGANLPATNQLLPGIGPNPDQTVINETNVTNPSNLGSSESEDRIFAPWTLEGNPAFDDQTNGPGGAGSPGTLVIQRPFRNMVGRGPVLDSSDDIAVVSELTQSDEIIATTGRMTAHMVWDTAEVSDAGRAFSVPRSD